jgi:hypothetical protein
MRIAYSVGVGRKTQKRKKNMQIEARSLARTNNAESAATALRALGCKLSPAHDRLWLVPPGSIRAATQIARENQYPAAFKIERKVTAEI